MSKTFFSREFTNHRNISSINPAKIEAVFSVIGNMNTDELRNVTTKYQVPLSVTDKDGNNLIHKVVENLSEQYNQHNKLNMIKFLVNNNVNPDAPNKDNITPLHLACLNQYSDIISYLLSPEIKANPNYQDNIGNSPFHYYFNGLLKIYKPQYVNDFIISNKTKKESKEEDNYKDIQKTIWDKIKNEPGIKAIENTIPITFLLNLDLKDEYDKFTKKIGSGTQNYKDGDWKSYKEELTILYGAIEAKMRHEDYWNNFKFDDYPSPDFKVKDECQGKISESIDNILENIHDSESSTIDRENIFNDYYKIRQETIKQVYTIDSSANYFKNINKPELEILDKSISSIDGNYLSDYNSIKTSLAGWNNFVDPSNNNNTWFYTNHVLNQQFQADCCLDGADNYIDLEQKIFIGGARTILFNKKPDDFLENVSELFKNNKEQLLVSKSYKLTDDLKDMSYEHKLIHKYLYTDDFSVDFQFDKELNVLNNIEPIYKDNLKRNRKKQTKFITDFHVTYNFIMNRYCKEHRLQVDIGIQSLLYLAGYINHSTLGDRRLSLTHAIKPLFIKDLSDIANKFSSNDEKTAVLLSLWLYFLLSDKLFNNLYDDLQTIKKLPTPFQNIFKDGTDAGTVAEYCYLLYTKGTIDKPLNDKMTAITGGKMYINKTEWLVYAISKIYGKNKQSPILNHVVDTIFIIRCIEGAKDDEIYKYF